MYLHKQDHDNCDDGESRVFPESRTVPLACVQRRFVGKKRVKGKGRRQPQMGRLDIGRVKGEVLIKSSGEESTPVCTVKGGGQPRPK